MNFKNARAAFETISAGDDVEWVRSRNRARIDQIFNGEPPLDSTTAKKMNVKVNVNWGEASVVAHHARRQYYNAFLRPGRYFKVSIPSAPVDKRDSWQTFITDEINRAIKGCRLNYESNRSRFASLVVHGIGPRIWDKPSGWRSRLIAVEDLRVPTDTLCSFENLDWFAERRAYTVTQLTDHYENGSKRGWRRPKLQKILAEYGKKNFEETSYNWDQHPEKMAELIKQNGHYFAGDAVPTIPLWNMYFWDAQAEEWRLRVLPCRECKGASTSDYLFDDGNVSHGTKLEHILHVQFGDLSNKSPFRYHSVRSLGFLLYEPCWWMNLARCRFLQHTFEQFNMLLRTVDPAGRARAAAIELFDRGFLPEGVNIVGRNERHNIDPNLYNACMAQLKQLVQEASTSYTQNVDTGTQREQTAYETAVKVSMVNAMSQGLLHTAATQETFAYREICRRFTDRETKDEDALEFQRACREFGISVQFVDYRRWDIEPEIPIGAGNPVEEQTLIKQLMEARPLYNPQAQQVILHKFTDTITHDSRLANELVPLGKIPLLNDAKTFAMFVFLDLMYGLMVPTRPELNVIDQIETLLTMLTNVMAPIQKAGGGTATPKDVTGFATVVRYVQVLIGQLAQDKNEAERVRKYQDSIRDILNLIRAFQQRLAEKAKANGEGDGGFSKEVQMKLAERASMANLDMELKGQSAKLDQDLKQQNFALEQQRKDAELEANIEREKFKQQQTARAPESERGEE